MCDNINDNYAKIAQKMRERGTLRVHNIQLQQAILLSEDGCPYPPNWNGVVYGVAFMERVKGVILNAAHDSYELVRCVCSNGEYLNWHMLLSQHQAAVLEVALNDLQSLPTIQLPGYTPEELRDLNVAYEVSGNKFEEAYGEDLRIREILSHPYLFDLNRIIPPSQA